jgi:hypothetical protein
MRMPSRCPRIHWISLNQPSTEKIRTPGASCQCVTETLCLDTPCHDWRDDMKLKAKKKLSLRSETFETWIRKSSDW